MAPPRPLPSHPTSAGPSLPWLRQLATFLPSLGELRAQCKEACFLPTCYGGTASVDALSSLLLSYKIAFPLCPSFNPPHRPLFSPY